MSYLSPLCLREFLTKVLPDAFLSLKACTLSVPSAKESSRHMPTCLPWELTAFSRLRPALSPVTCYLSACGELSPIFHLSACKNDGLLLPQTWLSASLPLVYCLLAALPLRKPLGFRLPIPLFWRRNSAVSRLPACLPYLCGYLSDFNSLIALLRKEKSAVLTWSACPPYLASVRRH
ncbi:hypothetical protein BDR22DRAFT_240134 [Usnea florida]